MSSVIFLINPQKIFNYIICILHAFMLRRKRLCVRWHVTAVRILIDFGLWWCRTPRFRHRLELRFFVSLKLLRCNRSWTFALWILFDCRYRLLQASLLWQCECRRRMPKYWRWCNHRTGNWRRSSASVIRSFCTFHTTFWLCLFWKVDKSLTHIDTAYAWMFPATLQLRK